MTLRFRHKKPVGLDWTVCNDGKNDTSVWQVVQKPKKKKQELPPGTMPQGMNQRMSPETETEVIRLYRDALMSAVAVAETLGITHSTVFKVLRRNQIPTRKKSDAMRISPAVQARQQNRSVTGQFV